MPASRQSLDSHERQRGAGRTLLAYDRLDGSGGDCLGGFAPVIIYYNDGGRYNPVANKWVALTQIGAPAARQFNTSIWTGNEMIIWSGYAGGGIYPNDAYSYFLDGGNFCATSVVRGGNVIISFPTKTGRTYTLWGSEPLVGGSWTNTGRPAVIGSGLTGQFAIPTVSAAQGFFRVRVGP